MGIVLTCVKGYLRNNWNRAPKWFLCAAAGKKPSPADAKDMESFANMCQTIWASPRFLNAHINSELEVNSYIPIMYSTHHTHSIRLNSLPL
jgi:hypothetical protein